MKNGTWATRHLLRVGGYIAGFFWLAFVWGGIKAVSTPDTEGHSHLRGWALLIIAGAVMITTMDRWVKYLRVILGGGILGGLLATRSEERRVGKECA